MNRRPLAWRASVIAVWSFWLLWGVAIWRDWHYRNLLGFVSTGAIALIGTIRRRRENGSGKQAPAKRHIDREGIGPQL